ncbi:MAG: NAD(P)-dependent oxidoreductase, partial [Chloroflexi bacterium]|nr:NAD(P)-dependent oxidoreductase [Chloroflexota bacterium]
GYIGFGEVGYYTALGLSEAGLTDQVAYCNGARNRPPYTSEFRERAARAGVELVGSMAELADRCDLLYSVVIASTAEAAGREAAQHAAERHYYVDLNSCSAPVKRDLAELFAARGATYVDAASFGAALRFKQTYLIWACGDGAAELSRVMTPFGMRIRIISGPPGTAATLKMLRSVLMKGCEALLWELLLAGHFAGLDQEIREAAIEAFDETPFPIFADNLVRRGAIHAKRRADELEHVIATISDFGVEPIMARAICERLRWVEGFDLKTRFDGEPAANYLQAIETVAELTRGR